MCRDGARLATGFFKSHTTAGLRSLAVVATSRARAGICLANAQPSSKCLLSRGGLSLIQVDVYSPFDMGEIEVGS